MITKAEKETIRNIRITAQKNSLSPLAVHGPDSMWVINPANRGKKPVGEGWQHGHNDNQLLDKITAWTANTGLLCGDIGGQLLGIDLDITDSDVLAAALRHAKAMLPAWICHRYRCNSPKILIPYRAAEAERGKVAIGPCLTHRGDVIFENKIEVLGRGNQFVVAGRHTTGVELQWSGPPVYTLPVRSLPAVSHAQIDAFLTATVPLLGEPKAPIRKITAEGRTNGVHALRTCAPAHIMAGGGANLNAAARIERGFEKLGVTYMNQVVQECLWVLEPMADSGRGSWLPLVIACWDAERLGATGARAMCLEWCRTSNRFVSEEDFNKDWASFTARPDGATVATLIFHARQEGALLAALCPPEITHDSQSESATT